MMYIEPEMDILYFEEDVMTNTFIETSTNNAGFKPPQPKSGF